MAKPTKSSKNSKSTKRSKPAKKKTASMNGAGWTDHAKKIDKSFAVFVKPLNLGAPLPKQEEARLARASVRTDEYMQRGIAAWDQFGQRTGLASYDTTAVLDGIRESAAMKPVVDSMVAAAKLLEQRLLAVRSEGVLETDAIVAAMTIAAKRKGNEDLRPMLDKLREAKKKKRPTKPRASAKNKRAAAAASSAAASGAAPAANGANTTKTTKTTEKTYEKVTESGKA